MPKKRSDNRKKAMELFIENSGNITNREIAKKLDEKENTISNWKCRDKWNVVLHSNDCSTTKRKKGGQPNNKNAVGNNGGAPPKNSNAEKHGLFRKYLPEETFSIIEEMGDMTPLDMIWHSIQIQYVAIIRSQQIMYVRDREDKTVEKVEEKSGNIMGETWEVQQAWDKQAGFLKAQSTAITSLKNAVKDYLELEGSSKADAKEQAQDWKMAIIEIAKRRGEKKNGRTD